MSGAPSQSPGAVWKRRRRLRDGEAQRVAERAAWPGLPLTRRDLLLPILKLVDDAGEAAPRDLYGELVDRLGLDPSIRDHVASYGGRDSRLYDRTIRWAMQDLKRAG